MGKTVTIHTNLNLTHQREYAGYLKAGFERQGYQATVTADKTSDADIRVVQGPHYAKSENLGKRTIILDRCFWGHPAKVVTLAWLRPDGGREFVENAPGDRDRPELLPWKSREQFALVLNDFDRRVDTAPLRKDYLVETREHPARVKPKTGIRTVLARNDFAVGFVSTAMVSAVVAGLPVVALDDRSPVVPVASQSIDALRRPDREQWLRNLSYMNWTAVEISTGKALEMLLCQ